MGFLCMALYLNKKGGKLVSQNKNFDSSGRKQRKLFSLCVTQVVVVAGVAHLWGDTCSEHVCVCVCLAMLFH